MHFALTSELEDRLHETNDDAGVRAFVEDIEETRWDLLDILESDKAWDALHRCLTDGTLDGDDHPLAMAVLGGEHFHEGEEYTVSYVSPEQVREVSAALAGWDEPRLRERYEALAGTDYAGPHGPEDFGYVWGTFVDLVSFFSRAAAAGRAVIFTVDQ